MSEPAQPEVSVVTVLKNRYANFRHCARYLQEVEGAANTEHVVVDFCSSDGDIPRLYTGGLLLRHLVVDGPFTLNRGRNLGIEHARAKIVFLCDADILVEPRLIHILLKSVAEGQMFFPIIRDLHRDCDPEQLWTEVRNPKRLGRWRTAGFGMCGFTRKDWERIGRFDEVRYTKWGGDDLDFYRRARKHCRIIRHGKFGFFHLHHSRSPAYLNMHYQMQGRAI